jgi:hypothetical protein
MERFKLNDKVVYKGREHKVTSTQRDHSSKSVRYKVNGLDEWISDKDLSPLFVEKKVSNKQAEFAKKLIATENDKGRA